MFEWKVPHSPTDNFVIPLHTLTTSVTGLRVGIPDMYLSICFNQDCILSTQYNVTNFYSSIIYGSIILHPEEEEGNGTCRSPICSCHQDPTVYCHLKMKAH